MFITIFKKTIIAGALIISASVLLLAEGGQPGAYTKLGAGVRATGMGSAYTAAADDTASAVYNPAGLVLLPDLQLSAETYLMSFDRAVNYISIGKPFDIHKNIYSVGFSWFNYSAGGDIEVRSTDSYEPESLISDSVNVFIFTAATTLAGNLFVGGNFRYYIEAIGKTRGSGTGFDFGAILLINEWLKAGINVSNISTFITWNNSTMVESIPLTAAAGISARAAEPFEVKGLNLSASADFFYSTYEYIKGAIGGELTWNDFAAIRMGFDGQNITAGAGIKLKPSEIFYVKFDYAFKPDNILPGEANHRIGITADYIFPHFAKVDDVTKTEKAKINEW
ncbi:MAG: hypothetical protein CVV21_04335 [Candidatus Goldiibacteriota bacterium HGW-Goldbacteria-1]|nr:MAG: hypothetical protein CVV21_04335 [Candidatus Goldiibacteriota bacterium HGW-Goldbacteria-1]